MFQLDMHVHACNYNCMRTTVEITDAQRAGLLDLAARRGEKGFSRLVQEAVDRFLADEHAGKGRVEAALALEGSMTAEAADELTASVARLRRNWR
jgi:hypothetical protein